MRLIHEIRRKKPALAKAADKGSRKAAIRLFCYECMGGDYAEARNCASRDCPLWSYGAAAAFQKTRKSGVSDPAVASKVAEKEKGR